MMFSAYMHVHASISMQSIPNYEMFNIFITKFEKSQTPYNLGWRVLSFVLLITTTLLQQQGKGAAMASSYILTARRGTCLPGRCPYRLFQNLMSMPLGFKQDCCY